MDWSNPEAAIPSNWPIMGHHMFLNTLSLHQSPRQRNTCGAPSRRSLHTVWIWHTCQSGRQQVRGMGQRTDECHSSSRNIILWTFAAICWHLAKLTWLLPWRLTLLLVLSADNYAVAAALWQITLYLNRPSSLSSAPAHWNIADPHTYTLRKREGERDLSHQNSKTNKAQGPNSWDICQSRRRIPTYTFCEV